MVISRRAFGVGAVSTLAGLQSACSSGKTYSVVLIIADDLGVQLSVYGDKTARAPNLDKFAAQSIVYENAYVTQASCSSSRSSIFTGLYPHQNGQLGLAQFGFHLKRDVKTFPKELQSAGVYTGNIGKIHVGPESRIGFSFDRNGTTLTRDPQWVEAQLGDFLTSRKGDRFFLSLSLFDPHRPFEGPFDMLKGGPRTPQEVKPPAFLVIDGPHLRAQAAGFYNCVERFDYIFGKVFDILGQKGLLESTVVLFIGDHGPEFFRAKGTCYEAGVRIPLMVRLPDGARRHFTPKLASTVDLAPTICEFLGVKWKQGEGRSLARPEDIPEDRVIVTEFTAHEPNQYFARRSIRDKRYKLCLNLLSGQPPPVGAEFAKGDILEAINRKDPRVAQFEAFLKTPKMELYDLKNDPWEEKDLAKESRNKDRIRGLLETFRKWQARTSDPLLGEF